METEKKPLDWKALVLNVAVAVLTVAGYHFGGTVVCGPSCACKQEAADQARAVVTEPGPVCKCCADCPAGCRCVTAVAVEKRKKPHPKPAPRPPAPCPGPKP